MPGEREERRKHPRYGVRAPVDFLWKSLAGSLHKGEGFSRDIGTEGIFVITDSYPPAETGVQIEVFLPALKEGGSRLRMSAKAQVLRVEPAASGKQFGGFAAVSKSFALYDPKAAEAN